jgi:hypothetical protein
MSTAASCVDGLQAGLRRAEADWIGKNHAIGCHDKHRLVAFSDEEVQLAAKVILP